MMAGWKPFLLRGKTVPVRDFIPNSGRIPPGPNPAVSFTGFSQGCLAFQGIRGTEKEIWKGKGIPPEGFL